MFIIIFSWLILFLIIFLIGRLVLKTGLLSFLNIDGEVEWYEYFWIGFVAVIAILQIWSIFLPVDTLSLAFVLAIAGVSLALLFRRKTYLPKFGISFFIFSILILLIVSYFASLSGGWPDTHGYHLNTVKWSNLYNTVPGLANLHMRLGFNSSFFLFASMIDNLFLKDRSSHIALSLMVSVLSIEFLWIFLKSGNRYLKIFILLSLPILVEGIVHSVQVSSLSYDFALLIAIFAVCIELIKGDKKAIFIAAIISIMLITIKLSGAAFALMVMAFAIYKLVLRKPEYYRVIIIFGLVGIVLLAPYIIRNIILSGWPLYPLPVLGQNLPWLVPHATVVDLFDVIKQWAILPGSQYHTVANMSFLEWFPGWFSRNVERVELKIFFVAFLFLLGSFIFKFINKKIVKQNLGLIACSLASLVSIFYLIFSAPDLRFGGVYFWIFFASMGSFFFAGFFKKSPRLEVIVIIFSILLTIHISWPMRLDSELMLKSIRWDQSLAYDQVLITPQDGSPAFKVYTPEPEGSCGNSELPCTPYPINNFKQIVPGDISKGFAPVD